MSRDLVAFSALLGFDSKKRNNLHYLDDHTLLTSAGNSAQLIRNNEQPNSFAYCCVDMTTMQSKHMFGLGGGGVGAIAVHPSRGFFAVGDKGNKPNITIYVYPNDGAKLASVGASPDFLLTVWNWRDEQTILRCKAFGQEVFNVQFAPNDGGFLTTSGTGHIRFWKMASTFTGLKLQGDIAKFGKSELSDIEAFCVLPDKKVLSSTERGALLLWDGSDGMMKWWHFPEIDQADVKEDDTVAEVIPKDEFCVSVKSPHHTSTVADIRGVLRGSDHYLIQDGNGMLHRLDIDTKQLEMPSTTDGERATYELDLPYKTYGFRRVRKLTTDELVALASDPSVDAAKPTSYNPSPVSTAVSFGEVEVGVGAGPPIVLAALYCCASASCFLVSVGGVHAGAVYKCEWTKPFPVGEFPDDPQGTGQSLTLSHSQNEGKRTYQVAHDRMAAQNDVRLADEPISNVFLTNPVFVGAKAYVAFMDSVRIVDAETHHGVLRPDERCGSLVDECDPSAFSPAAAIDPNALDDRPKMKEAPDITHKEAYTIQDAKLKLEADIRANSTLAKKNSLLMANGDKLCDEVRKEMAYAYEQSELLLHKMRNKYVGNVAVELITLHGFQNGLHVQSFRTTRMTDELQERLRVIHVEMQELAKNSQPTSEKTYTVLDFIHKPKAEASTDDKPTAGESHKRHSSHPKEEADDPRDVAAIAFASSHMQDYKLKTSATKQMALLEEKMYEVAMGFNAKLLELRDLKLRLIEQIQDDNTTIKALDIDLAALYGTVTTALALPAEFHLGNSSNKATSAATTPKPPVHPVLGQSCVRLGSTYELSPLETEEVRIQCIQLQRQRQALDSKIVHAVQTFDEAIYRLRREKLKLDIALKKGEIKLMTRLGELVLLEQFESKENLLVSKLEKCKTDKAQVVRELTDCSDQLVSKRKDMDECQRTESAVQSEFVALELTATEQDIQAFQTEKQMRFNELDVIVALSKHQLRCLQPKDADAAASGTDPSALYLPETVENALVFNHSVVDRLASRILSLQDENKSLRQVFKDLHKQQSQLLRDKTRQNELIGQVNEKCNQLQLLKFGRLIDIDLLDKACDTGNLNELKTKVRTKEMHGEKQLTEAKGEQQRLKMEILAATQENTRLLTEIALLSERQFDLEKELNQADVNNTLVDDGAQLEKEMSERKKLVQLVKLQSREIDALKQEVLMLRGKRGRVHSSTH
ncbi:hypothetical protein DYB38_004162 [Aphanomyces astaci]|uniref:Cilia- and flagella-associated protein 43 n=1 Tax=Aphanomyces astaci TaxID=112090 RepID=A0A397DIR4_APHAT|nr:hypothetical protein DYB38_004162 [Aphanomyces astaci]